jgi:D-amino-acid dehydrogenase
MKIAVIGAGIIGITCAYELSVQGHEVTVYDQSGAAAENASFAPNGLIAPSLLHPLALSSSAPQQWQRFTQNLQKFSGLRGVRPHDLHWLWQWSQHGAPECIAQTMHQLHSLYHFSMERMRAIASHARLEYEHNAGQLAIVRNDKDEALLRPKLDLLKNCGIVFQELNRDQCLKIEPALALSTEFRTGIYFPNDSTANCRQFAMLLKAELSHKGAKFQFSRKVREILTSPHLALRTEGDEKTQSFDHIVLCTGAHTQALMPSANQRWQSSTVSSYTLTLPIRESTLAPVAAVWDIQNNTTVHRMGQRVRICAGTELTSPNNHKNKKTINRLYQILEQLFPGAVMHQSGEQICKSSSLVSGSGLPLLGASAVPGVWINAGHGFHGWGTACGSAKIIADLIAKKEPELAIEAFQAL